MNIAVKVKTGANTECVEQVDSTHFVVSVKAPPKEGKANQAVIRCLARHFAIAPSRVRIRSGLSSRQKVVDVT